MTLDRFGISTHLVHGQRLERDHFAGIADRGFSIVELFATRTHLDYHDRGRVDQVRGWLDELKLSAWSLHAPITNRFTGGVWGDPFSNASTDAARREQAVEETLRAVAAARTLGCRVVVLHLGVPHGQPVAPGDNDAGALKKSLVSVATASRSAGIQLALEVIPNKLATAGALLDWLEGDEELGELGACLDVGHAHLTGGAAEAAEVLSGYLVSTHLHDNRGREDDHLVPFDGTIDWPATIMALSKVGYSGPLIFEVPDHGDPWRTLDRLVAVRTRIQAILDELGQTFEFNEEQ